MENKKRLTKTEQKYFDAVKESGLTPVLPKELYFMVNHRIGGDVDIKVAENWIQRIRKKLGAESIVNRHGFGYLTKENYQRGLERIIERSSVEKE
jgi:hypothetical protein